jgi:hypothetical protein
VNPRQLATALVSAAISLPGFAPSISRGAPARPVEYVFFPLSHRAVAYQRGDWIYDGTLDGSGGFHLREKFPWSETGHLFGNRIMGHRKHIPDHEKACEFRSRRRLVPGTMTSEGQFVADPAGKAIWLDDYHYGQDWPIWNLPGYFVRKDKADEHRQWLDKFCPEWRTGERPSDQELLIRRMKAKALAEISAKE